MVNSMKSVYLKLSHSMIILIFIISLLSVSTLNSNASTHANNRQQILAIYDSDALALVQTLYNNRMIIDNSHLNITYVNVENNTQMNGLLNYQNLNQKYDEVWIVTEKISDFNLQMNQVINQVLLANLPLLIWTSELCFLNPTILDRLGVTFCKSDPVQYENSNLSYANKDNLTSLIGGPLPPLKSLMGQVNVANLQFKTGVYDILNIASNNSRPLNLPIPILFQPNYKSNILISAFKFEDLGLNNITTTTKSSSIDTSSINGNSIQKKIISIQSQANALSLQTLASVNQVSITNILSALTYGIRFNWSSTSNLTSFLTGAINGSLPTSSNGNVYNILQTDFHFPTITPQLATNIAIGTSALGLFGILIIFLRRYWIYILSLFIGIFAVFKVPSRKISVMDVYHNETRQNIIDLLNYKKSQGETVRNLSRELQIPLPTLLWHLQILEEFELIVKEKVKREIVIISMDYIEEFDLELKIFEMTFKSEKAKIFYDYLLNLNQDEIFTIASVVNHTSWSARTVIRYISKLLELKIIEQNPVGKGYKIKIEYFSKLKELV